MADKLLRLVSAPIQLSLAGREVGPRCTVSIGMPFVLGVCTLHVPVLLVTMPLRQHHMTAPIAVCISSCGCSYPLYVRTYSETCLLRTSKGTQNQYLLSEVLTIRVGLCT